MHSTHQTLLHLGQLDVGFVATLALHLGRDAANHDDGIGLTHLVGKVGEVGQIALADVATQHSEVAVAFFVFYDHIVGLSLFHVKRLVLHVATEESSATSARLGFLHDFAVDFQQIAVVGHEGVFHLAREGGLILSGDAHGETVFVDALGKTPGTKRGEVEFVVITSVVGGAF